MSDTALVFSGGGSLGAIHVGMLQALVEAGVKADRVAGTSVGSINAAMYAGRPDAGGVEQMARIWREVKSCQVFPLSPISKILGLTPLRNHLFSPDGLRALIRKHLPFRRLEDAPISIAAVATDLQTGAEVVLTEGPAEDALLASAAIPGVFPPVEWEGRHLIDGGVVDNSPVGVAIRAGARRVIVLTSGFACGLRSLRVPALEITLHSVNLMLSRQLVVDFERFHGQAELIIVPPVCPLAARAYDFSQTEQMVDTSLQATRTWIDGGGLERSELPPGLTRP